MPAGVLVLSEPAARRIYSVGHGSVGETRRPFDDATLPFEREQLAEHDGSEQHVERQAERKAAACRRPQARLGRDPPGRAGHAGPSASAVVLSHAPARHTGDPLTGHLACDGQHAIRQLVRPALCDEVARRTASDAQQRRLAASHESQPRPDARD